MLVIPVAISARPCPSTACEEGCSWPSCGWRHRRSSCCRRTRPSGRRSRRECRWPMRLANTAGGTVTASWSSAALCRGASAGTGSVCHVAWRARSRGRLGATGDGSTTVLPSRSWPSPQSSRPYSERRRTACRAVPSALPTLLEHLEHRRPGAAHRPAGRRHLADTGRTHRARRCGCSRHQRGLDATTCSAPADRSRARPRPSHVTSSHLYGQSARRGNGLRSRIRSSS